MPVKYTIEKLHFYFTRKISSSDQNLLHTAPATIASYTDVTCSFIIRLTPVTRVNFLVLIVPLQLTPILLILQVHLIPES